MFDLLAAGAWMPQQVNAAWAPSSRRIVPQVESAIERAWQTASQRLGKKLFDGPMCRLEHWSASPDRLELTLSRTSYRTFLGTNLFNAHLADVHGTEALANPVGLSAVLQTADGYLLLGRRNDAVAYHPNRVHPFAGALEPRDPTDIFADIRRELHEELHLTAADLGELRCIGLAQDRALRQPELIFHAGSLRTRSELESQLDRTEHAEMFAIRAEPSDVRIAMSDPSLTPIAVASLAIWLERC